MNFNQINERLYANPSSSMMTGCFLVDGVALIVMGVRLTVAALTTAVTVKKVAIGIGVIFLGAYLIIGAIKHIKERIFALPLLDLRAEYFKYHFINTAIDATYRILTLQKMNWFLSTRPAFQY